VTPGHEPGPARRRPAIVAVDDEPAVLAAVSRDLRRGFGERFRVLRAASGPEALEVLRELRTRGEQVAMLIADQRMPRRSRRRSCAPSTSSTTSTHRSSRSGWRSRTRATWDRAS
jgi:CheY-like chemotaxis protein